MVLPQIEKKLPVDPGQGSWGVLRGVGSPESLAPRELLARAARGEVALKQCVLEALLASQALDADQRARELGEHFDGLVQMLMTASDGVSPEAAMKMITTLGHLQREQQGEARRTMELLAKILRPNSPMVKITASAAQVNLASINLGGGEQER